MKKCMVTIVLACFCTLVSQNAMADADLGLKSVGVNVGMVSPEHVDATFGLGVFANNGYITPEIQLESRIDYWGKSDSSPYGDLKFSDVAVGARGKYMFPTSSPTVHPFAGLGLGMHFLHSSVEVPPMDFGGGTIPGYTVSDSETRLGLDLGGGFEMPVNPSSDFVAEAWYGIVSDVNQFAVKIGMAWHMHP